MSEEGNRKEVQKYFSWCPFCSERSVQAHEETSWTTVHAAICNACGAKWHTYISQWTGKMTWAELTQIGTEGGEKLLGIRHKPEFWNNMAIKNLKQKKKAETDVANKSDREIIREKEVIVKIRCSHCRKVYDETLDKCPNCGASR